MATDPPFRVLNDQRCVVSIIDVETGATEVVIDTDEMLLEAPNWTLDGAALVLNGNGRLWRFDLASRELADITPPGIPSLNNDHVLDPDGEHIYLSADDGHLYRSTVDGLVDAAGPERVSSKAGLLHFLHGVSPDGRELAFIGIERQPDGSWGAGAVFALQLGDGAYRRLTDGTSPADGSEYSPDGDWIYFNTEEFDGHAQIARMRTDGSGVEQLTFDERVNWFPHLAPSGALAVYLAFPGGTVGHPADRWVDVMLVRDGEWQAARSVARVFGGQGTMNVNGWDPSGTRLAFVSYPLVE